MNPAEFGIQDERQAAVDSLHRIQEIKGLVKTLEDEQRLLEMYLRLVLNQDGEPVIDLERGLVATLKDVRTPATIDLVTLAEHVDGPQYLQSAARAGLLTAKLTPLRALKNTSPWADALLRVEMPGGVSSRLTIESTR